MVIVARQRLLPVRILDLEEIMLKWAVASFALAIVAALLGFTGMAGAAAGIAQLLFFVFFVLFVITMVVRAFHTNPPRH